MATRTSKTVPNAAGERAGAAKAAPKSKRAKGGHAGARARGLSRRALSPNEAMPTVTEEHLTEPPVTEPGEAVDADDLGRQWLAHATDQDNYESITRVSSEELRIASSLGGLSEGTVNEALQTGAPDVPVSGSLSADQDVNVEDVVEPTADVEFKGNAVRAGSLFDHVTENGEVVEPEPTEARAEDEEETSDRTREALWPDTTEKRPGGHM